MNNPNAVIPITICLIRREVERREVISFIDGVVREWYHCTPTPCPPILFVARQAGKIVGTMSLIFKRESERFPLEEIYDFDYADMPFPFQREEIAQFGRWTSIVPGISSAMIYASTIYAIEQGKFYGLTEVKPRIAERLKELGINLKFLANAKLRLEKIPECVRNYYILPPIAVPCMMDLKEKERSLRPGVMELVASGKIILDPYTDTGERRTQ